MNTQELIASNRIFGQEMYALARRLFPICRSITGDGVRQTLLILQEYLPGLSIHEVPTGTSCFDWEVPLEWNIRDAYILDPKGNKIVSFSDSNLHVVSYSEPVNKTLTLDELQEHLHSLPEKPHTIPYVTSYYERRWGFCVTQELRDQLKEGTYTVCIDSDLKNGHLTYGELILEGETHEEIFLSTYVCHPSLGNNELSGPLVTTWLAKFLQERDHHYTYRIIFIPETIGSITYLSRHYQAMKKNVIAGFNVTCIGDNHAYSYLPSRQGNTLSDRAAQHVLKHYTDGFTAYSYLERGSDERQYCSPGIDLPIATIMRSKYTEYEEYHTSDDNLDFISEEGLLGGFDALKKSLLTIEMNVAPYANVLCEPQLGKRGLYDNIGFYGNSDQATRSITSNNIVDFLAYCDGSNTLLDIAEHIHMPFFDVMRIAELLNEHKLIRVPKQFGSIACMQTKGECV